MAEQKPREQIEMIAHTMAQANEVSALTLGLDLDGVLDEAQIFFSFLTKVWTGRVVIITLHDDRAKADADLARLGIRYDELVLVDSFGAKAEVIAERGVSIYVDDQQEALKDVPPRVTILLLRNGGNYDSDEKLWTMRQRTCRLV